MKKEILKGFSMLILLVAIAFATAVVSANAQSLSTVSNIPFDFIVGGKAMPSGTYIMNRADSDGGALLVQSVDAKNSAARLTSAIQANSGRTDARLVFHRYGDRYFLAEVWNGAGSTGRQLTKCRQERAIEGELASISGKKNLPHSTYEIVEVVASVR